MIRTVRAGGRNVEYTLICARNRTNFLLQALPQGKIKLYAPAGCSLRQADSLVKQNIDKIDSAHASMDQAAQALPESLLYKGKRYSLNIQKARADRISISGETADVFTLYTEAEDINAQIKRWLVKNALSAIRVYLDKWSPTLNVPFDRVTIREQRTRWGSCSARHNLNFNWKLIMAPEPAMEYVVIHELCHLLQLNHSERFWSLVKARMPDYLVWKKWLKAHGQELRFP